MKNPITPSIIKLKRDVTESIYTGTLTVTDQVWVTERETGIRLKDWKVIYEDVPCRVVAQHIETNKEKPKEIYRMVGIDLPPEYIIPPGCKITVTYNGRTADYKLTSPAQIYTSHQRINTRQFDEENLIYA